MGSVDFQLEPHIFSVCRSEVLEFSRFLSCLRGARVVHVVNIVNLYDVISCNVRYHVRVKMTSIVKLS
jgi:hypothetical protein